MSKPFLEIFQNGSILTGEASMSSDPAIFKSCFDSCEQIAFEVLLF